MHSSLGMANIDSMHLLMQGFAVPIQHIAYGLGLGQAGRMHDVFVDGHQCGGEGIEWGVKEKGMYKFNSIGSSSKCMVVLNSLLDRSSK